MEKEECSSSESGWTTYISSPMEEDEEEVIDEVYYEGNSIDQKSRKRDINDEEKSKDSDDSMASDASSGPSYNQQYHQMNSRGKRRGESVGLRNGKGTQSYSKSKDEDHNSNNNNNNSTFRVKEKKNGDHNKITRSYRKK